MTMKPSLHRSLLFWSGILVMLFIGWGWGASVRGTAWFSHGDWVADNALGGVSISKEIGSPWGCRFNGYGYSPGHAPDFPIGLLPTPQWFRSEGWMPDDLEAFKEYLSARSEVGRAPSHRAYLELRFKYLNAGSWLLFIPHWMILSLTAATWAGMLMWWRRRMRRKTAVAP